MSSQKKIFYVLLFVCTIITVVSFYFLGGIDQERLQQFLKEMGIWTPVIYIFLYIIGTLLILPSTPLNLTGGALFGTGLGTLWTTIAAVIAAIIAFSFTRNFQTSLISQRFAQKWRSLNSEINQGGVFYIFAIRLLPIIPYGLVNFTAGLTSIKFKDYVLGTILGTIPGVLPFVMLGSSGVQAINTGDIIPIILALSLIGILVSCSAFYKSSQKKSTHKLISNNCGKSKSKTD